MTCFMLSGLLVLLTVFVLTSGQGECPLGCYCKDKFVDCSALMEWPENLPEDTERFRVSQMNSQEIPPLAFSYLSNISIIEFKNCNFGIINSCAFNKIPSIKRIVLEKCVIGSIESYAFSYLSGMNRIEIASTRIGRLKPFALFHLTNINSLTIVESNLPVVYTHAICNVSDVAMMVFTMNNVSDVTENAFVHVEDIESVQITQNTFWNLHCGVLDDMLALGKSRIFESNKFYCNCTLAYMLNKVGRAMYTTFLPSMTCNGPDELKSKTSLWHMTFADLGCRNLEPTTDLTCETIKLNPNPRCPTKGSMGAGVERIGNHGDHGNKNGNKAARTIVPMGIHVILFSCGVVLAMLRLLH